MRVRVPARNSFYYPDLSVCCDPSDREELYLARPCFIVEVASPATAGIDRREKRMSYATLASLEEYAVVDQDRLRVELYRREAGRWRGYLLNAPDDVLESSCLSLALTLEDVYEGVSLPPEVAEATEPNGEFRCLIWNLPETFDRGVAARHDSGGASSYALLDYSFATPASHP